MKKRLRKALNTIKNFLLNPHLMICFAIGWIITNGWAYVALGIGTYYDVTWLTAIAAAYLAILWSPLCAEGILTFIIAIFLLKKLFPNDEKTLKLLKVFYRRYKVRLSRDIRKHRQRRRKLLHRKKESTVHTSPD